MLREAFAQYAAKGQPQSAPLTREGHQFLLKEVIEARTLPHPEVRSCTNPRSTHQTTAAVSLES